MQPNGLRRSGAAGVQPGSELLAARAEIGGERFAGRAQLLIDAGDAVDQVIRRLFTRTREPSADVDAQSGKIFVHVRRLAGDEFGGLCAGALERDNDLLGRRPQRGDDALPGVGDTLAEAIGNSFKICGNALMGAGDGGADTPAVGDYGFALIGHFGDEAAHPPLVVRVGALKRRNLGTHQRFQFGGARKGPFDAIAKRRNLATNGLRERENLFGGQCFRLGEAHGDMRQRLS